MSPSKFNSLIYASKLESAGVPKEQASIHALALADVLENQMVTKGDLEAVEERMTARLTAAVAQLQSGFRAEMADFKNGITAEMADFKSSLTADMTEFKNSITAEMAEFKNSITADMTEFKNSMTAQMADFKADLLKWLAIISISQIGVTSTIVALIVHAR